MGGLTRPLLPSMGLMRVLDLFSGIGGFSLGLERAGMQTVAFCEIEPYPRAVLRKHWPNVPCYDDIRNLTADRLRADGIVPNVICGGFPCQDISVAGGGAGINEDTRSGLWSEYARLIGEIRPKFVIVENVSALLGRGLDRVLGDLAQIGYDAEWHCIPASAVGAPHRRDRIWIVANPSCERFGESEKWKLQQPGRTQIVRSSQVMGHPTSGGREGLLHWDTKSSDVSPSSEDVPYPSSARLEGQWNVSGRIEQEFRDACDKRGWLPEPNVGRVANGVPNRSHRLKCLGNAVIPQIPEIIGRAIMSVHNQGEHP